MANPLQQYFRQPKVFVGLPSHGVYNKKGSLDGDIENMPIYGMTGMDEILMKTPDALLSGDSTVKVISSCCPTIKDPWDVSIVDLDLILTAIRIATFGNTMSVVQICPHCQTENEYDLDLNNLIDHYNKCNYVNKSNIGGLTVLIKPLTYRQSTDFSLKNFQLQQQLIQVESIADEEERKSQLSRLFSELGALQTDLFVTTIESVDTGTSVVNDKAFIKEWLLNSDKDTYDEIKKMINMNQDTWKTPAYKVSCNECGKENSLTVEMDQSTFFVNA